MPNNVSDPTLSAETRLGAPARVKGRYLNLSRLVNHYHTDRPIDWPGLFQREAPLEVEIGYGNGDYLVRNAAAHPNRDFVGLEITWASTKRALRRLALEKLDHVRLLKCEAHIAFQRLFDVRSVHRVYALFPVPWPKGRHESRRLFSNEFLRLVNSRLHDGGEFHIVTDYQPLFEWVMGEVPGSGFTCSWELTPARFQTKYEKKWQENGQDAFYDILLVKQEHLDIPFTEDQDLNNYHVRGFDPDRFAPEGQKGPITVHFRDYVFDPKRRKGLVLALVAEDKLIQHVWIEVVEEDGGWLIRPAYGGNALPTIGVNRALELVRDAASA